MKKLLYLIAALALFPLGANAQDDMYFSSKKQKKEKGTQVQQTTTPLPQTKTYDSDDVIFNGTGIVPKAKTDTIYAGEAMPNDTLYIDEYETFEDGNGGRWLNGFKGGVDDYKYAVRNMNWRSFTTAVPIGSSMYWNIAYGPASFDWNVYERGGFAYLFPTWSNPLYWDYRITPSWGAWGWRSPWSLAHTYSYYAWGPFYDPFYDPFFYDPFYYGMHWGGFYGSYYWGIGHHHGFYDHHYASRFFNPGRSQASYALGSRAYRIGGDRQVANTRSRSQAGSRNGQVHRTQDRTRSGQGSRVSGRSVRSAEGSSVNSVRSAMGGSRGQAAAEGQTVRRGVAGSRADGVRSTSSYTRSSDGRNSTYSRPSSTRTTGVRSSEGGRVTRSMSSGSYRDGSSNRSAGSTTRSSSSVNRSYSTGGSSYSGGGFSGGSGTRSAGSSGGGSRGGGSRR